jgi:hypothetical protein
MTTENKKAPEMDMPPELKKFREKWAVWNTEQKLDALVNMTMGVAYRLDILASVVSGIPDVQSMEDAVKDKIKEEKKLEKNDKPKT